MFNIAIDHIFNMKFVGTGVLALATVLADSLTEAKSWEDLSLKVLLLILVLYLGKTLQDERKESKNDIASLRAEHGVTMEKHMESMGQLVTQNTKAIGDNTKALTEVTTATNEQNLYFKTIARNAVDQRLNNQSPKPNLP